MSLDPSVPISRPLPPSRARRISRLPRDESSSQLAEKGPDRHNGAVQGVLGGLRERTMEEVRIAKREDIEKALLDSWAVEEKVSCQGCLAVQWGGVCSSQLLRRVSELDEETQTLQKERKRSEAALQAATARHDELLVEQVGHFLPGDPEAGRLTPVLTRLRRRSARSSSRQTEGKSR